MEWVLFLVVDAYPKKSATEPGLGNWDKIMKYQNYAYIEKIIHSLTKRTRVNCSWKELFKNLNIVDFAITCTLCNKYSDKFGFLQYISYKALFFQSKAVLSFFALIFIK